MKTTCCFLTTLACFHLPLHLLMSLGISPFLFRLLFSSRTSSCCIIELLLPSGLQWFKHSASFPWNNWRSASGWLPYNEEFSYFGKRSPAARTSSVCGWKPLQAEKLHLNWNPHPVILDCCILLQRVLNCPCEIAHANGLNTPLSTAHSSTSATGLPGCISTPSFITFNAFPFISCVKDASRNCSWKLHGQLRWWNCSSDSFKATPALRTASSLPFSNFLVNSSFFLDMHKCFNTVGHCWPLLNCFFTTLQKQPHH